MERPSMKLLPFFQFTVTYLHVPYNNRAAEVDLRDVYGSLDSKKTHVNS